MQSRAAIRYAKAMYDIANEENSINEVYKDMNFINELNSAKQIEAYLDIKGVKKDANGGYTDDALSKLTEEELDAIKAKLGSFNQ